MNLNFILFSFGRGVTRNQNTHIKMKVSAIVLFCIVAVAVALPQPHDGSAVDNTKITLADIESEMLHGGDAIYSDNPVEAARQKRFVFHLKKLALAKAGLLGLG